MLILLLFALRSLMTQSVEPLNVDVKQVTYRGKAALRLVETDRSLNADTIAIVRGVSFHNGGKENPGVYESYTDLVPGEWTHVKIVVDGTKARLYVNRAPSRCSSSTI